MTTIHSESDPAVPSTTPSAPDHRRALVVGSRTALIMLLIAAVALVALAIVVLVLGDPPEVSGWLRSVFGRVFGFMAVAMAAILGVPAAIGVWALSGATADGATPALSRTASRALGVVAVATLVLTSLVVLTLGSRMTILDLALIGLAALPTLGLAGAVASSPRRGRGLLAATALLLVSAGIVWFLVRAYTTLPR